MKELIDKNYEEIVNYLLDKYGTVNGDYFLSPNLKTKNPNIKRSSEGLYIHHIDEDKGIMLSNPKAIIEFGFPFEWQKSNRLVYCDLLEHLLLHVKIQEFPNKDKHPNCNVGIGGTLNFIVPELNDIFSGIKYKAPWKKAVAEKVIDRFDDYIEIIKLLKKLGVSFEDFTTHISLFENRFIWDQENNSKIISIIKNEVWKK